MSKISHVQPAMEPETVHGLLERDGVVVVEDKIVFRRIRCGTSMRDSIRLPPERRAKAEEIIQAETTAGSALLN